MGYSPRNREQLDTTEHMHKYLVPNGKSRAIMEWALSVWE